MPVAKGPLTNPAEPGGAIRRRSIVVALALGLPLSGLFLWLAVRGANVGHVRDAVSHARVGLLLLAVAAFLAVYGAQAERWRTIVGRRDVGLPTFAGLVVSSIACNNILPARLGDVLRARWLGRSATLPAGRALATVVLDRVFDLVVLFALLIGTLPEVAGSGWSYRLTVAALALLIGVGLSIAVARAYARRRARARLASRGLARRVVRDVVDGLAAPMGRKRLIASLVLSVVAWLSFAGAAVCVARSIGVHLSLVDAFFATAVLNLGVAIPSSPGFVGTYQWLGVAALDLVGVDRTRGLAFAILMQAVWYVPTTLVGGALLAIRGARMMSSASVRKSGSESAS